LNNLCFVFLIVTDLFSLTARRPSRTFFQGKDCKIGGGFGPCGFLCRWGRLISPHWGKPIPGNPEGIVQNMVGASSLTATNYVYGVAKPDGLTVLLPNNSIYIGN